MLMFSVHPQYQQLLSKALKLHFLTSSRAVHICVVSLHFVSTYWEHRNGLKFPVSNPPALAQPLPTFLEGVIGIEFN